MWLCSNRLTLRRSSSQRGGGARVSPFDLQHLSSCSDGRGVGSTFKGRVQTGKRRRTRGLEMPAAKKVWTRFFCSVTYEAAAVLQENIQSDRARPRLMKDVRFRSSLGESRDKKCVTRRRVGRCCKSRIGILNGSGPAEPEYAA